MTELPKVHHHIKFSEYVIVIDYHSQDDCDRKNMKVNYYLDAGVEKDQIKRTCECGGCYRCNSGCKTFTCDVCDNCGDYTCDDCSSFKTEYLNSFVPKRLCFFCYMSKL